jgi:hypothetical protein
MLTADFSRGLPDLRSGVWRHYKGHFYLVLGYAHDANAEDLYRVRGIEKLRSPISSDDPFNLEFTALGERAVVVYIGLELDDANKGPRLAVRTAEDFFALVCSECGSLWECTKNHQDEGPVGPVPRFEYMGPAWYGWPR